MHARLLRLVLGVALPALLLLSTSPAAGIEGQIRQLIRSHDLRDTRVGIVVKDLGSDRTLAAIHADRRMIPASNMKLITTAAALNVLGEDFRFQTKLKLLPAKTNGDPPRLLVKGSGDPAFGDPVLLERYGHSVDELLSQWVEAVDKTDHDRFGAIVVDDRIFDRDFVPDDWPRGQLIHHYCAQVAGLNFHENVLHVLPIPAEEPGQAPDIRLFPEVPFMEVTNRVVTGRDGIFAKDRRLGTNHLRFHGAIRHQPSEPYKLTVHDPPMVFGRVLGHRLSEAGIAVDDVTRPADQAQLPAGRALAVATTTLKLVLKRTNQQSENMFAEALLKRLGRHRTGRPGSWQTGRSAVRTFLHRKLGPGSASITVADGSGMSRRNRVTPRLAGRLLAAMHRDRTLGPIYRNSLARPGKPGTLDDRLTELTGELYAKTGYLNGVSALSGYLVVPRSGGREKTLAFSMLFNGFAPPLRNDDMKRLQNGIVRLLDRTYAQPTATGG